MRSGSRKESDHKYYLANREKIKARSRQRYIDDPEGVSAVNEQWRKANPDRVKATRRARYRCNPQPSNIRSRDRYRGLRQSVIEAMGGCCVNCGFLDIRALQLDHIDGYKGEHKDRKPFTSGEYQQMLTDPSKREGLQVLCANCNWIKRDTDRELFGHGKCQQLKKESEDDQAA